MKIHPLSSLLALALFISCTTAPRDASRRSQPLATESAAALTERDYARTLRLTSESNAALHAGDYSRAQSLAAQATSIAPQFASAWVAYGMASVPLGQIERAHQAYERALFLYQVGHHSSLSDANQALDQIMVLSFLGRPAEAEAMLKQARTDYPYDRQVAAMADHFTETQQAWDSWKAGAR